MGMSLGMIGAIGGVGQALNTEGQEQYKDAARVKDVQAKKDYEGWLLAQQQQYQIATEQRTDTRAEQTKDRDFTRLQGEAPARRDIKVGDEKALAVGKSDAAAQTSDQDAKVAAAQAVAKETPSDRDVKAGHAKYFGAAGEAMGAKATGIETKLDPADVVELHGVQQRIQNVQSNVDKAMADPTIGWNPDKNPGQKQLQLQLTALQLRERAILTTARAGKAPGAGAAARDPVGIRGGGAGGAPAADPPAQPGMVGAFQGPADDVTMAIANIKDPQERANAMAAMQTQLRQGGGKLPANAPVPANAPMPGAAAPAPSMAAPAVAVPPAAAVAAPAKPPMGPLSPQEELDAARDPAMEAELNDPKRINYTPQAKNYLDTIGRLKRNVAAQANDVYRSNRAARELQQGRDYAAAAR